MQQCGTATKRLTTRFDVLARVWGRKFTTSEAAAGLESIK